MKLPSLSFLDKKEKPQYFLALILRDDKTIAVVFEELLGKIRLVGQGEEKFETSIEEASQEEILDLCDKSISKAEEALPENVETQKTIFSLKDSWVEDNKIKKEYLEKLKKISDELGLVPIGFLLSSEALINLLQKEEGAPISAVFAQIGKNNAIVSLLKASKFVESKKSQIHESASFTVDTVLKHFEVPEILPARVIIFSSGEDDLSQEFIGHHWSKSLPFLHLPQIHVLPEDFDVKAVMFGAAKQMGFQIMPEFKKETLEEVEKMEHKDLSDKVEQEEETTLEEKQSNLDYEEKEAESKPLENGLTKFGFSEEDVAKIEPIKNEEPKEFLVEDVIEKEKDIEQEPEQHLPARKSGKSSLAGLTSVLMSIPSKVNLKSLPIKRIPGLKGKGLIIPIVAVLVILIGGFFLASSKTANVALVLEPKNQEESQNATFSLSGNTDSENKIIAAESVTTSEDGSVTISTTGKKETGNPAKGNVTFYSRFTQEKTIPSGTVVSSNSLDFTTDKDIKIASASADASAQPSTATVAVTAKKIGKESNLPSGTKFNVGNLSTGDIIAKNENAFSGGTKKDIKIVSKDDYEKLEEEIIKNLEQKAKDSISKKISSDKALLPAFVDASLDDTEFTKKVDEEANQVTIKGTVTYTGLSYDKKDLSSFTKSVLISSDEDVNIDEKNLKVDVTSVKKKNDKQLTATLKIQAKILPKMNIDDLIGKIKGKEVKEAEAELRQLNQISEVKISISPPLPFLSGNLPMSSDRIKFKVSSNE